MPREWYKRWTDEEIESAAQERLKGRSTQEVADELEVHPQVLRERWKKKGLHLSDLTKSDTRDSAVEMYGYLKEEKSWRQICALTGSPYTKRSVDKLRVRTRRMCDELGLEMPQSAQDVREEPEVCGGMLVSPSWDVYN